MMFAPLQSIRKIHRLPSTLVSSYEMDTEWELKQWKSNSLMSMAPGQFTPEVWE